MAAQHPEPRRLAKEAELMYKSTRAVLQQAPDGSFRWVERLRSASGSPYTLAITYPSGFPFERPKAFIVDPLITSGPHVLGGGWLCLFDDPWASDPKCTA